MRKQICSTAKITPAARHSSEIELLNSFPKLSMIARKWYEPSHGASEGNSEAAAISATETTQGASTGNGRCTTKHITNYNIHKFCCTYHFGSSPTLW